MIDDTSNHDTHGDTTFESQNNRALPTIIVTTHLKQEIASKKCHQKVREHCVVEQHPKTTMFGNFQINACKCCEKQESPTEKNYFIPSSHD